MSVIKFTKAVASGNDFIIIEKHNHNLPKLAQVICDRKYGIGADGVLILGKSAKADFSMRIFNPDGSEAEMCGNGLRCAALFSVQRPTHSVQKKLIETKAGILETEVTDGRIKVGITAPKRVKLNIPLKINKRTIKVNFIDTGVPHTVIFVEGLDKIDLVNVGRQIRFHQRFMPRGTNVDFVEILDENNLKIRTYERGVEAETLACGTGSVATAIISILKEKYSAINGQKYIVKMHTRSGETLKIYFVQQDHKISDVYLEGKAKIVYQGQVNI